MELLVSVREARIRDVQLRDQAMRAAKSAVLNTAEAAGRVSRADKARVLTIARGEACEAAAAVEVAVAAGDADRAMLEAVNRHANQLIAMLTALMR